MQVWMYPPGACWRALSALTAGQAISIVLFMVLSSHSQPALEPTLSGLSKRAGQEEGVFPQLGQERLEWVLVNGGELDRSLLLGEGNSWSGVSLQQRKRGMHMIFMEGKTETLVGSTLISPQRSLISEIPLGSLSWQTGRVFISQVSTDIPLRENVKCNF